MSFQKQLLRLAGSFLLAALALFPTQLLSQTFSKKNWNVGSSPVKLVRADFNNDGIDDLATANGDGTVTVLLGKGDGTFRRLDASAGQSLLDLVATDLNHDGHIDLVALNQATASTVNLVVLLGNGDGTFQPPRTVVLPQTPRSLTVADFDGDGNVDVAVGWNTLGVATPPPSVSHVTIFYGDGSGGFARQQQIDNVGYPAQVAQGESSYLLTQIAAADMNRDGRPDLVFVQCCGGFDVEMGAVYMLQNNGGGSFANVQLSLFSVPRGVTLADVDQDGFQDLLLPYSGCHTPCSGFLYARNHQDGTLQAPVNLPQPANTYQNEDAYSVTAADVNNDGLKDIITSIQYYPNTGSPVYAVAINKQSANGSFGAPVLIKVDSPGLSSLLWGDFNRDGRADIAGVNQNGFVTVLLNTTASAGKCAPSSGNDTVHVCVPAANGSATSPVRFLATPHATLHVQAMKIYVDGAASFLTLDDRLSALVQIAAGTHKITTKAWTATGTFSKTFTLKVP
ncbi:MAG: VCBS repeat-containing protein [Planctomycetota bacterium]